MVRTRKRPKGPTHGTVFAEFDVSAFQALAGIEHPVPGGLHHRQFLCRHFVPETVQPSPRSRALWLGDRHRFVPRNAGYTRLQPAKRASQESWAVESGKDRQVANLPHVRWAEAEGRKPNATQFAEPDISRHALACGSLGKTDEPRAIALRLIRDLWQTEWHWACALPLKVARESANHWIGWLMPTVPSPPGVASPRLSPD